MAPTSFAIPSNVTLQKFEVHPEKENATPDASAAKICSVVPKAPCKITANGLTPAETDFAAILI